LFLASRILVCFSSRIFLKTQVLPKFFLFQTELLVS
jgi:hypothetical protein